MFNVPKFVLDALTYQTGDAVGGQLRDVCLNGEAWEDQNPAALRLCREWFTNNFDDLSCNLSEDALEGVNEMLEEMEEHLA